VEYGDGALAESVREAAQGAESGIETMRVPREQAELVRRVFRRYAERVNQAPPAQRTQPEAKP
jgi:hypothetical protein